MIVCNTRNLASNITGVQRYTIELLSRLGNRVDCIAPKRFPHGARGHLWEQLVLPGLMKGRWLWSPCNTGPLAIRKQVVTIMDVAPMDHPEWTNPRFAAWYRFLTPHLLRRVHKVLTISEFSKQRIIQHCPEAALKIHVTHLAADQRFSPVDIELVEKARKRLSIPTPHYLVALGSIEPRKNIQRLLMAWERIHSRIPQDIWLVLAGAEGKKLVFGELSFENLPPRVHLTGQVPDELLPALYSGAIASPYLSLYEGFGLPPLEAMACGTPVLTSNVASLPEVVGDAAITVDPYDLEGIGDGLVRLIADSDLRADLRRKGLVRARQFSWEKTAEQTWKVLEDLG